MELTAAKNMSFTTAGAAKLKELQRLTTRIPFTVHRVADKQKDPIFGLRHRNGAAKGMGVALYKHR